MRFGAFEIDSARREIRVDGARVDIGVRGFDILRVLIEAEGSLVTKDQFIERVWGGVPIDENNLQVLISAIRKALGHRRDSIRTVSGHGYRLIPDSQPTPDDLTRPQFPEPSLPSGNIPRPISRLVGREQCISDIRHLLKSQRLITLTGLGGIGKTRLALEIARRVNEDYPAGAWLLDFGSLEDGSYLPDAIASALGFEPPGSLTSFTRAAQRLRGRQVLLIFDTCEHVVSDAAAAAEIIIRVSPHARILATSREPLRAEGEFVFPVPPLYPPSETDLEKDEILGCSAVQLFLTRSREHRPASMSSQEELEAVAIICRQLGGIPLAIELAAAQAATLGVVPLLNHLDTKLRLLQAGWRTATARHRTLEATFQWSYDLLCPASRIVLERLAVFSGSFDLQAATAVATSHDLDELAVIDGVADLVAKSLIALDCTGPRPRYRLLETTRAFAYDKLQSSGASDTIANRHAENCLLLITQAQATWKTTSLPDWLRFCKEEIANIRAALSWALSSDRHQTIGLALAADGLPILFELSLIDECLRRTRQALAILREQQQVDPIVEMKLLAAYSAALVYTNGPNAEGTDAWMRVVQLATVSTDKEHLARGFWGLWNANICSGQPKTAQAYAQRFVELATASNDETKCLLGHRILGISYHYLGDQNLAHHHFKYMLESYSPETHRWGTIGARVNHTIVAQATYARVLWLQGQLDTAKKMLANTVADAFAYDHAMTTCYVLTEGAVPLAILLNDAPMCKHYLKMLNEQLARRSFEIWRLSARCFQEFNTSLELPASSRLPHFRNAIDDLIDIGFTTHLSVLLAGLSRALALEGNFDEAIGTIDRALDLTSANCEGWYSAELNRTKGELLLRARPSDSQTVAADFFRHAMRLAKTQGAIAFELRSAVSYARLALNYQYAPDAVHLLREIYERFPKGQNDPTLRDASDFLKRL